MADTVKVFEIWSGKLSGDVALLLRDWLPKVIQSVKPYVSTEDIAKGARWGPELAKELEESKFGIVCCTRENVGEPWIYFEAGALSKAVKDKVCPLLIDLPGAQLRGPLVHFQYATPREEDMWKLIVSLNAELGPASLEAQRLKDAFDLVWKQFDTKLRSLVNTARKTPTAPERPERDLLEEILEVVRNLQRSPFPLTVPGISSVLSSPAYYIPAGSVNPFTIPSSFSLTPAPPEQASPAVLREAIAVIEKAVQEEGKKGQKEEQRPAKKKRNLRSTHADPS